MLARVAVRALGTAVMELDAGEGAVLVDRLDADAIVARLLSEVPTRT